MDKPQRFKADVPFFSGHAGPVLDFDFNPFSDNLIASASEDATIKLWEIPEGGLTSTITTPLVTLTGHHKKITLINFHPTASSVIGSVSADQTVRVWDMERGEEINSFAGPSEIIQDFAWDFRGNTYAISARDKSVRIVDARNATETASIPVVFDGVKSTKLVWLGDSNKFVTVGFTRNSTRQLKIWDARNLSAETLKMDIDQAAGVIMPFYDSDINLLYLAGKGDGNVRCFEVTSDFDQLYPVTEFRSSISAKGMAFVPKRGLNIMNNEVARLMKLTASAVEPLSFIVPRKADGFQEDIYPDTFSGEPSHSAEAWIGGSDELPKTMKVSPGDRSGSATPTPGLSPKMRTTSFRSSAALQAELDRANARILELEEKLRAAGISTD